MTTKKQVKKSYEYRNTLVDFCKWCAGKGWTDYLSRCLSCNGSGGHKYKKVKVLVSEEVIE